MKKLFVAATLGLALISCGGEDEKTQTSEKKENSIKTENVAPTVCDCVEWSNSMMKEMVDTKDDAAKKALEEKYADKIKACDKLGEGKTPEEIKKMMEEAERCK